MGLGMLHLGRGGKRCSLEHPYLDLVGLQTVLDLGGRPGRECVRDSSFAQGQPPLDAELRSLPKAPRHLPLPPAKRPRSPNSQGLADGDDTHVLLAHTAWTVPPPRAPSARPAGSPGIRPSRPLGPVRHPRRSRPVGLEQRPRVRIGAARGRFHPELRTHRSSPAPSPWAANSAARARSAVPGACDAGSWLANPSDRGSGKDDTEGP